MGLFRVVEVTSPAAAAPPPGDNLPAPGASDLTDIPTVLDELGLKQYPEDGGAFLQRALTDISDQVAKYCKRTFQVEGLAEQIYFDQGPAFRPPGDVVPVPLARWPLAGLVVLQASASTGGDFSDDFGTDFTPPAATLSFASTAGLEEGMPAAHRAIPFGATIAGLSATTVTLSAPLSTADPALATEVLAGDTVAFGLAVARTLANGAQQALGPGVDFAIDPDFGRLIPLDPFTFAARSWGTLPLEVLYSAGYASVPADIVGAVLRWITWRWHARGVNPAIREQDQPGALGRVTYWVGGPPNSGGIPSELVDILDRYRVPSV